MPPMAHSAHGSQRMGYVVTLVMLALALAFPVGLMIFDPTLMFERGWEQYVGTAIYAWAVLTLTRELFRLWKDEAAFEETPKLLTLIKSAQSGNSPQKRTRRSSKSTARRTASSTVASGNSPATSKNPTLPA
jgi:hypothetical protein